MMVFHPIKYFVMRPTWNVSKHANIIACPTTSNAPPFSLLFG
jgi:hypothetical protein